MADSGQDSEKSIYIGSRLELMLDDTLLDSMEGLSFALHRPRPAEVVMTFDEPWEGPDSDYVTVFKDGNRFRMYYANCPYGTRDKRHYTGYAESSDGIHWQRPSLGLIDFQGSTDNNLLMVGAPSHNFGPFVDANPDATPQHRYKAIGGPPMHAYGSPDGVHWEQISDQPVLAEDRPEFKEHGVCFWGNEQEGGYAVYDSPNIAFWDTMQKQYVCYFRAWVHEDSPERYSIRHIFRGTSPDMIHWSESEPIGLSEPISVVDQFYTNATQPYFRASQVYLAFPMRYASRPALSPEAPKDSLSECVFMFSRDGRHFTRIMEAYIRPGLDKLNWYKHNIMAACGLLATSPEELSLYYTENYSARSDRLRRGVLRLDGFMSLQAPYKGGECTTKPFRFYGNRLRLNVSTGVAGTVRVEVQDPAGRPMDGFGLEDCEKFYGDDVRYDVRWRGSIDLSALTDKTVRLRFVMNDADLYSFRFWLGSNIV